MAPCQSRQLALAAGTTLAATAALLGCLRLRQAAQRQQAPKGLRVRLLYASVTGTSEKWARHFGDMITAQAPSLSANVELIIESLSTFNFDSLMTAPSPGVEDVVVMFLSTHTDGLAPPACAHFPALLEDHVHDFRVSQHALAHLRFAVVGFGSDVYVDTGHYCTFAAQIDQNLAGLAGTRLAPLLRATDTMDMLKQLQPWLQTLIGALQDLSQNGVNVVPTVGLLGAEADADDGYDSDGSSTTVSSKQGGKEPSGEGDLEDVHDSCAGDTGPVFEREMVTGRHKAQLIKEGYKLIGTHSAVKLCRWTKSQLRGRGACYKHSFYGISSYNCMEATPSLACANKCVFCWRHHKNPVGTSWKWKMDPPDQIVREGIDHHVKMIKEAKGIPGVQMDRFKEALTVKHCALSLVGEPIMYPRINELLDDLHRRHISSFLVTNAQFPEAIKSLTPVTQLYVSVDAATKEALKEVDRPLFADFWDRYLAALRALRDKRQRTVYRMTLVKDHNMSDAAEYSKLVALGEPDFIEIKSVTFCGESKASSLNMSNVPWHEEVKQFSEAMLAAEGLGENYEMACEHQHSCIVLIAHKKYKINGKWHTWIDYDKFHALVDAGKTDFDSMDYVAETPDWAIYNSKEAGFDPKETRVYHNRTKARAKAGLLSEEQLRHYPSNPADS